MSAKRIVPFLGDYEVPAGWPFSIEFLRRPAAAITGRTIGVFGQNEEDADETITTSDVTISRNDSTGDFTVTFPGALTLAKVGKRFKCTVGFTAHPDGCSGEFTMRPYAAGR